MSMFCVSIFDGSCFKGKWFDTVVEAMEYVDTCLAEGKWKDIQLQHWSEDDLTEFMEKGIRSAQNRLRVACSPDINSFGF